MNKTLILLAMTLTILTSSAASANHNSIPAEQDTREFFIDEAQLPFDELTESGIQTERLWGIHKGAAYRIEVPENWNGELVMWAHGFRGSNPQLLAVSHPLRLFLISQGFAWAASSYTKNYYDVKSGLESTNNLVRFFSRQVKKPSRVFIGGDSLGGHVTAAAVEQFPNYQCPESGFYKRLCKRIVKVLGRISGGVKYSGALPICGVMGDKETLGFGINYRLVTEQLIGVPNQLPVRDDYSTTLLPFTISQLFANGGTGFPTELTEKGIIAREYLRQATGGDRPTFDIAFARGQETIIGTGLVDGTIDGITGANVFDNSTLNYQLDSNPAYSDEEIELNANILRVSSNPSADPKRFLKVQRIPTITGRLTVPMVSLHTLGDTFVPFHNQQVYGKRVAARGASDFLVQRAIRDVGHCSFDPQEFSEAFADMYAWATLGIKPLGDDVQTAEVVADANYGCQFTRRTRSELGIPACPEP